MTDDTYHYQHEDESTYSVDIRLPDDTDPQTYHVDLVQQRLDDSNRPQETRHPLGSYRSYGEAEEHFYEAETRLRDTGLADFTLSEPTAPQYTFEIGMSDDDLSRLEAVKTWQTGPETHSERLPLVEYGMVDAARVDRQELEQLQAEQGLEVAMHLAETMAVSNAFLDADRDDPRLFANGPADPFTTQREREQRQQMLPPDPPFLLRDGTQPINTAGELLPNYIDSDNVVHWFDVVPNLNETADASHELRYFRAHEDDVCLTHDSYPVMPVPNGDEPDVLSTLERYLQDDDLDGAQQLAHLFSAGYNGDFPEPANLRPLVPSITLADYMQDGTDRQPSDDTDASFYTETVQDTAGRSQVDEQLVTADTHDPLRDGEKPLSTTHFQAFQDHRAIVLLEPIEPDVNYSFEVAATSPDTVDLLAVKWWQEDDAYRSQAVPVNSYERTQEGAAFRDFLELNDIAQEQDKATALDTAYAFAQDNELLERDTLFTQGPADEFTRAVATPVPVQSPVENPYWHFDTLPVVDPEGESLGHTLHMVVYDGVAHDPEMVGAPTISEDEPFRMLEVAHFETTEAADKFTGDFSSYLVPGLLDAPELAEEVARLEELPVEWRTLDEQEREQYRNLELTLTRDPANWHLYNPNAEQDARIEAEGISIDLHHGTYWDDINF